MRAPRIVWLWWVLLLLGGSGALTRGQTPATFPGTLPPAGAVSLHPFAEVFEDSSGTDRPLAAIRGERFAPFARQDHLANPKVNSLKVLWFRFRLANTHPTDTLRSVLYAGRRSFVTLWEEKNGQAARKGEGGYWVRFDSSRFVADRYGLPLALPPGQVRRYWVRATDYFHSFDRFRLELYAPQAYRLRQADEANQAQTTLIFFSAALGGLLFMSLFTAAQYVLNRDSSYAWYAAYLAGTLLWLWRAANLWFDLTPPLPNPTLFFLLTLVLGYGIQVTYLHFLGGLLEVPRQQPRLWRGLRRYLLFALVVMGVSAAEILVGGFQPGGYGFYRVASLVNYGAMLVFLGLLLRNQHPLRRYAITGSVLLLLGVVVTVYLNRSGFQTTSQLIRIPSVYFAWSTLLEMLCFSLALGRRSFLQATEKQAIQRQLIAQLEENQRLQRNQTAELERRLAERTAEVLDQAHQLEIQRLDQLRSEFDRRLTETEMAGLRSQMNPHFIFNCLNSIKLYALENDAQAASGYLTKFSRLIRLVLENSRSERVTLENELEALKLYIDLEAMRFKNKLRYQIRVADDVDAVYTDIPPLLLQPYVENAIWHGLMHKPEGGTVTVSVEQSEENQLRVTITDDGIGRQAAAELKSKSATRHKSFGMQVTGERIRLINEFYRSQTRVEIHDLVDADGYPAGTEVVLWIPV